MVGRKCDQKGGNRVTKKLMGRCPSERLVDYRVDVAFHTVIGTGCRNRIHSILGLDGVQHRAVSFSAPELRPPLAYFVKIRSKFEFHIVAPVVWDKRL